MSVSRIGGFAAAALLACSAASAAQIVTGTLSGAGMVGTGTWSSDVSIQYTVNLLDAPYNDEAGFVYEYIYEFCSPNPELSHLTIEVTEDPAFTSANIRNLQGSVESPEIRIYDTDESGSPGIPANFYGAKFNTIGDGEEEGDVFCYEFSFISDRPPVWGDIYAKGGQEYAYNSGFLLEDVEAGHIAVPDGNGNEVPEPAALGLLLMAGSLMLRQRKAH